MTSGSTTLSASATVSCASGKLLGGGGVVTTTDSLAKIQLVESYPSAIDTWTATGSAKITNGNTWTVEAYAICGS